MSSPNLRYVSVSRLVNSLLRAFQGHPLQLQGTGKQTRTFLHVEDACAAFDVVMRHGVLGEVYNIGSTHERSVLEVGSDIAQALCVDPLNVRFAQVADRPSNDQRYCLDYAKIHALGWSARISWTEGLRSTVQWYGSNRTYWGPMSMK
jgi:dTDP-D-glucose 4,6-dehydratase